MCTTRFLKISFYSHSPSKKRIASSAPISGEDFLLTPQTCMDWAKLSPRKSYCTKYKWSGWFPLIDSSAFLELILAMRSSLQGLRGSTRTLNKWLIWWWRTSPSIREKWQRQFRRLTIWRVCIRQGNIRWSCRKSWKGWKKRTKSQKESQSSILSWKTWSQLSKFFTKCLTFIGCL